MKLALHARRWGGPDGGHDGMSVAVAFLAWTLCELGHEVRAFVDANPPGWSHPRLTWCRPPLDFMDELTITTVSGTWHRTADAAEKVGASERLLYWHHHGAELPPAHGCRRMAPTEIAGADLVLPPSSWAVEAAGQVEGFRDAILVPGAGPAKGGHVALDVAHSLPDLDWLVLSGRSSAVDRAAWRVLGRAEVIDGIVEPEQFLSRARAVLAPTRAETYGLVLVEAAVRGIPVVCTDLPATRAALGESASFVRVEAPAWAWSFALNAALEQPLPRLNLPPYRETVAHALEALS